MFPGHLPKRKNPSSKIVPRKVALNKRNFHFLSCCFVLLSAVPHVIRYYRHKIGTELVQDYRNNAPQ